MTRRAMLGLFGMICILLCCVGGIGEGTYWMQLSQWKTPSFLGATYPHEIAVADDGNVFFTLPCGPGKPGYIGGIDPATNLMGGQPVGGRPYGLAVHVGTDYYWLWTTLPEQNKLYWHDPIARLEYTWTLPTASAWPLSLLGGPVYVELGGAVYLWMVERDASKIARFSLVVAVDVPGLNLRPSAASGGFTIVPSQVDVLPQIRRVDPSVFPARGILTVLLPMPKTSAKPFEEWVASGLGPDSPQRLTHDPLQKGRLWYTSGSGGLGHFDPLANSGYHAVLPAGTKALGVCADRSGHVWFTDTAGKSIGAYHVGTEEVRLWPIPGGVHPFDIGVDGNGNVWFTDRDADVVGYLSPARDEFVIYALPAGSRPMFLDFDKTGGVWFTAEKGSYVGRLAPLNPVASATGDFAFLGEVFQSGPWVRTTVSYDGGFGPPVYVTAEVLNAGAVLSGFSAPEVPVAGMGVVTLLIKYTGKTPVTSDQIRFVARSAPGGMEVSSWTVGFGTTWSP